MRDAWERLLRRLGIHKHRREAFASQRYTSKKGNP